MSRLVHLLTLSTAKARICAWLIVSTCMFIVPYGWLTDLSLWQRLGWDGAPSVGLTRAYWLTLHGQPADAWHRNWLIVPVLVIGLVIIVCDLVSLRSTATVKSPTLTSKN
jgi:hypothetical protein